MSSALEQDSSLRLLALGDGFIYARALHLAAELGIADLLAGQERSTEDLARRTGTDAGTLHSMLRALAGCGVFTESAPGRFALTEVGACLRSDHPRSVRTTIAQSGRINARAFQHADHALRTGDGAFATAFGQPFWEFLRDNPQEGAAFDTAMQEHSRVERGAIVEAYDFPRTGPRPSPSTAPPTGAPTPGTPAGGPRSRSPAYGRRAGWTPGSSPGTRTCGRRRPTPGSAAPWPAARPRPGSAAPCTPPPR
ncbi:methyltransferase dimerization domain-containing protein [Streptomyces griseoviridis]